jgi:hypothetical protein
MRLMDALGWLGAGISCSFAIPQLLKTLRSDRPGEGMSVATWVLLFVNAVVWAVWAFGTGAYPAGLPSLVNGPIAAYVVVRIVRDRRRYTPGAPATDAP